MHRARGEDKKREDAFTLVIRIPEKLPCISSFFYFLRWEYPFNVKEYMGEAEGESEGGDQEAWNSQHKQISFTVFQTLSIIMKCYLAMNYSEIH